MTVISVLDDEGCFANKNIYVFVVSLHIITICHLLTLGTDVLLVTVRSWHRHHARLLFILGSSWSLENHQLAVRVPAWLPPDADRLPAGSPENDMNVLKI